MKNITKSVFLLFTAGCLLFTACGREYKTADEVPVYYEDIETSQQFEENTLIAVTETEEQAKEIAEKCGIILEKWENSLAVFYTEKDLDEVIALAEKMDLPPLSKNYIMTIYDE